MNTDNIEVGTHKKHGIVWLNLGEVQVEIYQCVLFNLVHEIAHPCSKF